MRKCILSLLLLFSFGLMLEAQQVVSRNDARKYTAEERPWIWWFWLGNVVSEDLIDQHLATYSKAGYGGVVIISTYGVKGYEDKQITYRSPEWYKMIRHTLKKASQLNLKVDMALSSAWPFGGAQVMKTDGAKFLKRVDSFEATGSINRKLIEDTVNEYTVSVSAFSDKGAYLDLTSSVDAGGNLGALLPEGKWRVEAVIGGFTNQMVKRSSPGGEGLVIDNFDKQALLNYLKDFEKDLESMKGVRALFNDSYEVYGADYTSTFITEFEKRRGYSPKPYFSLLLKNEKSELTERFLCDYRATIADLILDNFVKNWTDWSNSHSFKTMEQAHGSPSNLLDMYAAVDIPQCESFGPSCFDIDKVRVDEATRREPYKRPDVLHMKFASSAGNLMGRSLVSSETATWLTNHFRTALSQVKPEVDKLFLAGINHIHLISATNTPLNSVYPGWVFYPAPDFGPRSSLMNYMPDFSLYISRVQNVLQHSKPDNDVLLYYPVFDYFSEIKKDLGVLAMMDHIPTKWGSDWPFAVTARQLKASGYQFDYVSDKLLQKMTVQDGKAKSAGGSLYKAIVIPACKRMPIETMRKLMELAKSGVPVIFDKEMPGDVPGLNEVSQRLQTLLVQREAMTTMPQVSVVNNVDSVLQILSVPKTVLPACGLEYIRKELDGGKVFFIANQKSDFQQGEIILDRFYHNITAYNPISGHFSSLALAEREGKSLVTLQLQPGQSVILFADCGRKSRVPYDYFKGTAIPLQAHWTIDFEKGPDSPASVSTSELISWTELGDSTHCYYSGMGIYKTTFDLPAGLEKATRIRLKFTDVRDMAEVFVNGRSVGKTWSVPYQVDFDASLLGKTGNKLEIRVQNIATNRLIGMDRHQVQWQECYVADPKRRSFNTADWELAPSGLIGTIVLIGNR